MNGAVPIITFLKVCTKCKEELPLQAFPVNRRNKTGRESRCSDCRAIRPKYPINYTHRRMVSKRWRAKHPEQERAHHAVSNAIRDGRLIKPSSCSRCGDGSRKIHGHHSDYSQPLAVEWICDPCHKAEHRRERYAGA